MNGQKLKEAVENATTFGDVFDLTSAIYDNWKKDKTKSFEHCRTSDGWLCKVMEVKRVVDGKDTRYTKSFVLQERGATAIEAFKLAAAKVLK